MKLFFASLLMTIVGPQTVYAEMSNDSQANQYLLESCENSRIEVLHNLIRALQAVGLTYSGGLEIGVCTSENAKTTLRLPQVIKNSEFTYQGLPFPLVIRAHYKKEFGWPLVEPIYEFRWNKRPVYDHLGSLIGYDYSYRYTQTSYEEYHAYNAVTGKSINNAGSSISNHILLK